MTADKSVTAHFVQNIENNDRPRIDIALPTNNSTVSGHIDVQGTATDNDTGVIKTEVRIDDGVWITAEGTTAWTYTWDTASVGNGIHIISARSYDNIEYSAVVKITITVDNEKESDVVQLSLAFIISAAAAAATTIGFVIWIRRRL